MLNLNKTLLESHVYFYLVGEVAQYFEVVDEEPNKFQNNCNQKTLLLLVLGGSTGCWRDNLQPDLDVSSMLVDAICNTLDTL